MVESILNRVYATASHDASFCIKLSSSQNCGLPPITFIFICFQILLFKVTCGTISLGPIECLLQELVFILMASSQMN